jgi:hypothetical protein
VGIAKVLMGLLPKVKPKDGWSNAR